MADSTLGRWLRAMNPIARPRNRAEAERSARSFVVAVVIALLASIPSTIWMFQSDWMATIMEQQLTQRNLSGADMEVQRALMGAIWPWAIAFGTGITVLIYGVMAFIQWRYMTRALPIIALAYSTYTLVAGVGVRLTGAVPEGPDFPLWITALGWSTFVVQTVINIAALQGAIMLHRLRLEART